MASLHSVETNSTFRFEEECATVISTFYTYVFALVLPQDRESWPAVFEIVRRTTPSTSTWTRSDSPQAPNL